MLKVCGVGVAMLPGHSWTPHWLIDCLVNGGTTRGPPPGCPSWTGRGQVRCRLMAVGGGGALVVVAGVPTRLGARESWVQGEGGQQVGSADTGMPGGRW